MSKLSEKARFPEKFRLLEKLRLSEKICVIREHRRFFRFIPILLTVSLLLYYCFHPSLYSSDGDASLLQSVRTYKIILLSAALIFLWLVENTLSDFVNRILSWIWFMAAPFAIYFSLLFLNKDKYNIDFFALDKIALLLTFAFLYLVLGILYGLTGSIRFSVIITAVAVATLGIVNCFVISFRGMALSAADLFSVTTAAAVASEYTYTLDWYMVMEILFTILICTVSLKLRRGRMMPLAARGVFLALVAVLAGGYYYLCGKTSFLEDHDIRSEGFTHQLRYKKYDMLFTTLTTCFYLVVDKPEGYSLSAVQEIAAEYVDTGEENSGGGLGDEPEDNAAVGNASADEDAAAGTASTGDDAAGGNVSTDENAAAGTASTDEDAADVATSTGGADAETASADASETPTIIVIMNESWADYTEVGNGLELSEDYMPFIRSLTENTIKGTAYSSVFGGNTPNSEYEFLTGNTMAFLPASSVGFNLFVRGNLPSLASQLGSLGYYTLAMHPYRGTNYRRNIVYPQIGFDTYYTRDDFQYPVRIRNYISDETLFNRIILEYEENLDSGQPLFSYNVTIQNHGGYYSSNTNNLDMEIEVLNTEFSTTKAEIYVNLVKATDDAFQGLVEYFEDVDEPVIILMFGDHQPNIGDSAYEYLLGGTEDSLTDEELMEKYKIPFICWANYDIEEETIEATSLNYLYSILADRLGLEMTGYQEYLLDLSEEIPVINSIGYWGSDGVFYELDDKESPYYDLVNEYNILEYNDIFGGDNRYYEFFTLDGAEPE
ncbi:MAG: sulfatase-like hydrolase/transferase [Lachnospiraceae bacterium]|nr:sulfatase-like hydrolase/transferase [Lachnospiraceae bacterium]